MKVVWCITISQIWEYGEDDSRVWWHKFGINLASAVFCYYVDKYLLMKMTV